MLRWFIFVAFAGLAACTTPLERLAMPATQSDLSLRPLVSSVMVRTVVLPTYAAAEEIAFESENGLIASSTDVLWADEPQRAVTLAIVRNMTDILGTDVGPDPWPFVGLPDVAVDIQVERMLSGADGVFRLSGQVYIGGDGIDFRNRTQDFDISKPVADQTFGSLARAQAEALQALSEQISRSLGR